MSQNYTKEKSQLLNLIINLLIKGIKHSLRVNFFKITAPVLFVGAVFIFIFVYFHFHILLLKKAFPIISDTIIIKLITYPLKNWFFLFYGFFCFLYFLILGKYDPREKINQLLEKIGLKNSKGEPPLFIRKNKLSSHKANYIFNSNGLSLEEFQSKKAKIEAIFQERIESIDQDKKLGFIKISFNKKPFPKKISYEKISKEKSLATESFYIGLSNKGVLSQNITDLPHLLIAGSTGSGKSVFFKQTLLSLLKSSPKIQMYLIDLKGGLEFRDFAILPNVKVIKTIREAVSFLTLIKNEMEDRFDYLEKFGKNKINILKDKKDRIVVGIDEASVLYNSSRGSDDYELILKAKNLTEHIAKLSRASSIHLILATQKVTKETIDTRIQENISGRMCFKLNTLEGSMRALGDARASRLPSISGRGIWHLGHKFIEVQAPNLEPPNLKKRIRKYKIKNIHQVIKKIIKKCSQ